MDIKSFTKPLTFKDAEQQIYYYCCLKKSLEAKIERIEPLSDEFENTMITLFTVAGLIEKSAYAAYPLRCEDAVSSYR